MSVGPLLVHYKFYYITAEDQALAPLAGNTPTRVNRNNQ